MQVHHDEEVANRIDPESCAAAREGIGEALTGDRTGQPLSRESTLFPGADVVPLTEGNTAGRDIASAQTARRGQRPWHVQTLLVREPGGLAIDRSAVAAYCAACGSGRWRPSRDPWRGGVGRRGGSATSNSGLLAMTTCNAAGFEYQ